MPDAAGLAALAGTPSVWWLALVSLVAGTVYGFAGFGAALIFMPLATAILRPEMAVAAFAVSVISSALTVLPPAWRVADRRETAEMLLPAIVTAPLGILILRHADPTPLRWGLSLVVAATLAALMTGWRYEGRAGLPARLGVGVGTGIVGGATGLTGPVLVLFHLSGPKSAATTRANSIAFLTLMSVALLPLLALQGAVSWAAVRLGVLLLVPYGLGCRIGQALFRPERERLYRGAAYAIIAAAVVLGLPIHD